MWWQTMIILGLVLIFPKKVMFFIRAGYCLQLFTLYSLIVRMWTIDDIQGLCSDHATWFSGITLNKLEGSVPILKGRNIMIIGNHRNFCDFTMHDVITEHSTNFLSRALVGFVLPFMGLISLITDGIWYFVRGSGKDFDEFFEWIDAKFASHKTGRIHLLVYPEGHRNLKKEPLPLRSGMIRYAFSRKIPLQMFMCSGYDEVLNEKKFSAKWGRAEVMYKIYEPIFTDQYMNFDSLMDEVRSKFLERFNEVHNAIKTNS
ncbi:hypothetical protein SteCoe_29329 [Stentor coeruleus]|uniref:Phospholipid/glycerol acyltransferase domain-containing protein n=1 Tax=Stentor coeruleus TaxID=5963 RepID=A0A1R2B684_9CILI|nr:hypothetical protein SteCoe_29329 [Stentor coeruleus]